MRTKILDLAEEMTQTRGFNGFSYIDLAAEIGIKTSSIHYYFKLKDDLAAALVERTHQRHREGFEAIEAEHGSSEARLQALIAYFQNYIAEEKFCLCGMLAAELQSVSPRVASLVRSYFDDFRKWLTSQFEAAGEENPERCAIAFLSGLEGALLLGRLSGDPCVVSSALQDQLPT